MKHIKLFENKKISQREKIEDIFIEYIDKKSIIDNEELPQCEFVEENEDYLEVQIYDNDDKKLDFECFTISQFDKEYEERLRSLNFIKKLKIPLLRLEYLKYKWDFSITEDYYQIRVFYEDTQLTLTDAFKIKSGRIDIDTNILRGILKRDYDLTFVKYETRPSRNMPNFLLFIELEENINMSNSLIKDLENLKIKEVGKTHNAFRVNIVAEHPNVIRLSN